MPPAITLPSYPAVLAPMACIRMKFSKSSSCATRAASRPAMGKALMPAAPMSGLMVPWLSAERSLPNSNPAAV